MTSESLGHIFIFIGIISTWLFPLWLYFHWLRNDDEMGYKVTKEMYEDSHYPNLSYDYRLKVEW